MKQKVFTIFLLLIIFLFTPHFSAAQENMMTEEATTPTPTATPTPDYVMVYPGILPGTPLYTIKTMRDRLVSLLIGDPLKKAEFDLLQSDKRIGAAIMLFKTKNQDQQELAIDTISKGLNYYDEAIQKANEAKRQGDSVTDITLQLKKAGTMYLYVLQKEKKLPKSITKQLATQISRLQQLTKQVSKL